MNRKEVLIGLFNKGFKLCLKLCILMSKNFFCFLNSFAIFIDDLDETKDS